MFEQERSSLMMNPFVDIHIHPQPKTYPIDASLVETVTLKCPIRGRGLLIHTLTRNENRDLFGFFLKLIEQNGELALRSKSPLVTILAGMGFLVTKQEVVDWPQFKVQLDIEPSESSEPVRVFEPRWRVADTFLFQSEFELHPKVRWPREYDSQEGLLRCFGTGPAFWLGAPGDFVAPLWVTSEEAVFLTNLSPGETPPPLPTRLAQALVSVGAIVQHEHAPPGRRGVFASAHAAFIADRYATIRALLPAAELAALRSYYAALLAAGLVPLGDRQHPGRFSSYNDPVGRFVHVRLASAMAAIAGQPVKPSFCYFFSYVQAGIDLRPHKDRPQAEFSISLQLDYYPEPAQETGWPLWFSYDDREPASADLGIGDAVFYHGQELTHYRTALPDGHQSRHLVLEYVPEGFRDPLI